ncbi:hypothetical protein [Microbacterium luticocti]|uniref:hypothetical protein n=1 Tax=Microbacterium luticocti TaxID=451764 RepID=UPI0003F8E297|nr:hypothetical protein [Microbacterium luticocti]
MTRIVTSRIARLRTQPLPAPQWVPRDGRASLSFTAVRARLWMFGATIATVTIGAGALVSVLAIMLTPESARAARVLIVAAALCLCLPLVLLTKAPFRARTVPVALSYDADALTITAGVESHRFPLREITGLLWCTGTEYSRIVVDGPGPRCSLLVGIARPLPGQRADLPEIGHDLHRALSAAGLSREASRRGYTRYRR